MGYRRRIPGLRRSRRSTNSPLIHISADPKCACGALTPAQAQAWFDKFKACPDIPWNYPNDCCYNLAHVMAQDLKAAGVDVGKAANWPASK